MKIHLSIYRHELSGPSEMLQTVPFSIPGHILNISRKPVHALSRNVASRQTSKWKGIKAFRDSVLAKISKNDDDSDDDNDGKCDGQEDFGLQKFYHDADNNDSFRN